jgi:hypothetical protein
VTDGLAARPTHQQEDTMTDHTARVPSAAEVFDIFKAEGLELVGSPCLGDLSHKDYDAVGGYGDRCFDIAGTMWTLTRMRGVRRGPMVLYRHGAGAAHFCLTAELARALAISVRQELRAVQARNAEAAQTDICECGRAAR